MHDGKSCRDCHWDRQTLRVKVAIDCPEYIYYGRSIGLRFLKRDTERVIRVETIFDRTDPQSE